MNCFFLIEGEGSSGIFFVMYEEERGINMKSCDTEETYKPSEAKAS